MNTAQLRPVLEGQRALVIGIANEDSIAYGCAKAFRSVGADLAISWLNEKARRFVEPLARELEASITGEVDVSVPGQLEALFEQIRTRWAGWTFSSIRSPSRPRPIFRAAFSTVLPKVLPRRWTFPAIPSSGWPSSRRR
jgi:NAD(P)-dependent dehydrogenase (short-subunit alcohol dehydrogenase family)